MWLHSNIRGALALWLVPATRTAGSFTPCLFTVGPADPGCLLLLDHPPARVTPAFLRYFPVFRAITMPAMAPSTKVIDRDHWNRIFELVKISVKVKWYRGAHTDNCADSFLRHTTCPLLHVYYIWAVSQASIQLQIDVSPWSRWSNSCSTSSPPPPSRPYRSCMSSLYRTEPACRLLVSTGHHTRHPALSPSYYEANSPGMKELPSLTKKRHVTI